VITLVRKQALLPDYLTKTLDTYIAMLKSGLPELRNNAGGHGEAPSLFLPTSPRILSTYRSLTS
jgi:hypothetical protein